MSRRHRTLDSSAESSDTAISNVEDRTSGVQRSLLELGNRPLLRTPGVGRLVDQADMTLEDIAHPVCILSAIGGNPPYCTWLHPRSCKRGESGRQQPALVMAGLRPRVRKEHPDLVDRSSWHKMLHSGYGICLDDPYVVQALAGKVTEHPGNGWPVNLEGQQIRLRSSLRHWD